MTRQGMIEMFDKVLSERGTTHGDYALVSSIAQKLKDVMHASPNWSKLPDHMKESLDSDAFKTARILVGDFMNTDSWFDKAGYAVLVWRILKGQNVVQLPADCE